MFYARKAVNIVLYVLEVLEVLEMIRCALHCMLEAVEGIRCVLELQELALFAGSRRERALCAGWR